MTQSTIFKLNQLNQRFYQAVAKAFSATRQTSWEGWEKLLEYIAMPQNICDIGCGNGRFGLFCAQHANAPESLRYLGIDQDQQLLDTAQSTLQVQRNLSFELLNLDIVKTLANGETFSEHLPEGDAQRFSTVVAFGVLHHIPSQQLREAFLQSAAELLDPDGVLVVACWQFDRNQALMERKIDPKTEGFSAQDLEKNDYFLTWERNTKATRYCHLVTEEEQNELIAAAQLKLVTRFSADGKSGDQNTYLILKKSVTCP